MQDAFCTHIAQGKAVFNFQCAIEIHSINSLRHPALRPSSLKHGFPSEVAFGGGYVFNETSQHRGRGQHEDLFFKQPKRAFSLSARHCVPSTMCIFRERSPYPLGGHRMAGGGVGNGGMGVLCLLISVPHGLVAEATSAPVYSIM